jgi:hypothetical protein
MAGLLTAFLAFEMKTFGLEPGNVHGPDIAMLSEEDTFDCGTCTLVTSPANEVESHEYK